MNIDNNSVLIIVRKETVTRLGDTCFRGIHKCLAGNFARWWNAKVLLEDPFINDQLHRKILIHSVDGLGTYSITIDYPYIVGWSGTDDIEKYPHDSYREYRPNRHSSVMKISPLRKDILAPLTKQVTFVYELKREDGDLVAIIHSIYPGKDIGPLSGDLTASQNIVMFDWKHPGKTI